MIAPRHSDSGTFSALRERDFAWYFAGNLCFFLAMQMNQLLRGYLAFQLTDSAIALGFIAVTMALPMLFIAPIGGVIADRYNKRTLLIVVQTFTALVNAALAVLIVADLIEFWHLLLGTIGLGLSISLAMPARQAMVPNLVPQHRMMNAISLQMGSMNLTRIVGPAAGGLLIAPLGVGVVWSLGVLMYIVAVVTLFPLPVHGMTANNEVRDFRQELLGGFRYVANQPVIRLLMITGMLMPLFAFPVQLVLPVFAEDVFDQGAGALGILMAAAGAGGLVGALISANLDRVARKSMLMLVGTILMSISYVVFAQSTSIGLGGNAAFALGLLAFGIGNIGGMLFQTTNNTTIQALITDDVRGRVMSLTMMAFGVLPLGVLPLTIAVDRFGAPTTVAVSSTLMLTVLLLFFALSSRLRNLRVEALAHAELSPAQAAALVAEGKISEEDAARLTGRAAASPPGSAVTTRPAQPVPATSNGRHESLEDETPPAVTAGATGRE